jgi:hypothetical protein
VHTAISVEGVHHFACVNLPHYITMIEQGLFESEMWKAVFKKQKFTFFITSVLVTV